MTVLLLFLCWVVFAAVAGVRIGMALAAADRGQPTPPTLDDPVVEVPDFVPAGWSA